MVASWLRVRRKRGGVEQPARGMSEQWRARDSVLCGSLCFMFLVLLHQVRAPPPSARRFALQLSRWHRVLLIPWTFTRADLGPFHTLGPVLIDR